MVKATKEDAERLAAMSTDCSFLLTHLIRQKQGAKKIYSDNEAKNMLASILSLDNTKNPKPILNGCDVGWYKSLDTKVHDPSCPHNPGKPGYFFSPTSKSGVCFTDSTFTGLRAHREVFHIKYGLAFTRKFLFERGANPCLNIRESIFKSKVNSKSDLYDKLFNFVPDQLIGYVNIINESFDATHEREWRYLGDFEFKWSDIMFVFCPWEDFLFFSKVQKRALPILFDLQWLDKI